MMKINHHIIITILLFLLTSCPTHLKAQANLIETYVNDLPHLEFVEGNKGNGQTIRYSLYRVSAEHAAEVEQILVDRYGMGLLRLTCCGWESENGRSGEIKSEKIKQINPDYYLIAEMYGCAEKEDVNGIIYIEKDRSKIDYFYVKVSLMEI